MMMRPIPLMLFAFTVILCYFTMSTVLLLACLFLFFLVTSSSPHPSTVEHFAPVYKAGLAAGLQYGVAAVQGRRAYMEDMHQIIGFDNEPAAAGVGMTHFFAVYDG